MLAQNELSILRREIRVVVEGYRRIVEAAIGFSLHTTPRVSPQFLTTLMMVETETFTPGELKTYMYSRSGNPSYMVARLVEMGILSRALEGATGDRRMTRYRITPKGQDLIDAFTAHMHKEFKRG